MEFGMVRVVGTENSARSGCLASSDRVARDRVKRDRTAGNRNEDLDGGSTSSRRLWLKGRGRLAPHDMPGRIRAVSLAGSDHFGGHEVVSGRCARRPSRS